MAPGDRLRSEYLALSIIPTGSKPQRSTPLMVMGVLIALGASGSKVPSELHSCADHVGGRLSPRGPLGIAGLCAQLSAGAL